MILSLAKKKKNKQNNSTIIIQTFSLTWSCLPNESDPDIFISQLGQVYEMTPIRKL